MATAISCSNDSMKIITDPFECLNSPTLITPESSCEDLIQNGSFCDQTSIGEFSLERNSMEYMKYSCFEQEDILEFENAENEKLTFEMAFKSYDLSNAVHISNKTCPLDNTKFSGICLKSENLSWVFRSTNSDLELLFSINTRPDITEGQLGNVGDFLSISRKSEINSYLVEFNVLLTQRTHSSDATFNQEFYESIELLDEEFNNVFSVDRTNFANSSYKFFL